MVTFPSGPNSRLHLNDVSFTYTGLDEVLDYRFPIKRVKSRARKVIIDVAYHSFQKKSSAGVQEQM